MNCAYRLLAICRELGDTKFGAHNNSLRPALSRMFGVDERDTVGIYVGMAKIRTLAEEVEERIRSIPGIKPDSYLQGIEEVKKFTNTEHLNDLFGNPVTKHIGSSTQALLDLCAAKIEEHEREPEIEDNALQEILRAAQKLTNIVLKADLEPELKALLLNLLEAMRRAIAEYRFHGVDGLRRELFVICDRVHRNAGVFERNKEKAEVQALWILLTKLDTLTSVALNVGQIVGTAAPFLAQAAPLLLEAGMRALE